MIPLKDRANNLLILTLVSISLLASCKTMKRDDTKAIKVLSYNIHYGVGMDDKKDLARIASVIKKLKPDIIGLQEIGDSSMAAELGQLTGMQVVFGPSKESMNGYGDAILSRFPFTYVGNQSIPSASSSRYQAMCVDVDVSAIYGKETSIRFITTHFDWLATLGSKAARKAAVEVIEKGFFTDVPRNLPSILTGDLNAIPGSPPIALLQKQGWIYENLGQNLFTIPVANPNRQIDYVLPRPNKRWRILDVSVIKEQIASDHLPILMTLELVTR